MMPFKRLITGKKQPGGQGRSSKAGKTSRKMEDIVEMEGATPTKQKKPTPKPARGQGCGKGRGRKGSK